jgi:hypothetical protein
MKAEIEALIGVSRKTPDPIMALSLASTAIAYAEIVNDTVTEMKRKVAEGDPFAQLISSMTRATQTETKGDLELAKANYDEVALQHQPMLLLLGIEDVEVEIVKSP